MLKGNTFSQLPNDTELPVIVPQNEDLSGVYVWVRGILIYCISGNQANKEFLLPEITATMRVQTGQLGALHTHSSSHH